VDRYWLLTWTTYATWLPGDRRGFVSEVREEGSKVIHNTPGTACDADLPGLRAHAASIQSEETVLLDLPQAQAVAEQIRETATRRGWRILALAVMPNHVHVVVGAPGDPDPEKLLGDFKAWASRKLNQGWGPRRHWWTQSGSKRRKATPEAIRDAVVYVRDQPNALVVWLPDAVVARLAALEKASGAASARRCDAPHDAGPAVPDSPT
jgi:REP element-mobilizing transposase RayT